MKQEAQPHQSDQPQLIEKELGVLSPVRNLSKITVVKLCQVVLRTQLPIDALSYKKTHSGYREPF
jgi:hypothetical protein